MTSLFRFVRKEFLSAFLILTMPDMRYCTPLVFLRFLGEGGVAQLRILKSRRKVNSVRHFKM